MGLSRKWCFVFLLILLSQNALSKAIFYQPQIRDSSITPVQWEDLFDKIYQEGYREIVIQWTQYGSANFVAKPSFLKDVLKLAQSKKIKIWLGLYLPHDYYAVMEANELSSAEYFKSAISDNRRLLTLLEIQSLVSKESFAGWYLPMELTHKYLQQNTKQGRDAIWAAIKGFASSVKEKMAVSYFLSESTTLKSAYFDTTLLNTMGLELWLQKGDGIEKHTIANQLIKRMDCDIGVISENFIQTSNNNSQFTAKKSGTNKMLNHFTTCHKKLVFSLRYLSYSPLPLDE